MAKKEKDEITMKQISIAPWGNDGNTTYSIIGLGDDGAVYRFDKGCTGWVRLNMKLAECKVPHKW